MVEDPTVAGGGADDSSRGPGWWWVGPAAAALARRPMLWGTAARQVFVIAAPGWWHRRPFLPLPDPDYLHFRLITQYGDGGHPPEPQDVVTFLRWCRGYRAALR